MLALMLLSDWRYFFFKARADARLVGIRAKRVKEAADNPDDVTKAAKEPKKAKK